MSNPVTVELDSLIGEHVLDGVDTYVEKIKQYDWRDDLTDASAIRFRLDGVIYIATENPDDGYRSTMERLIVQPGTEMTNTFPPVQVLAKKKANDTHSVNDTLELIDVVTGKVVMEVGTDNTDDYYPYFVSNFSPENMATNQPR